MHKLLEQQLAACRRADGSVDLDALLGLVDQAYARADAMNAPNVTGTSMASDDLTCLHETLQRAEATNRVQAEHVAMMSHEVRTPLHGVLGMVGLLFDTALAPEQRSYAEAIRDSAEAMLAVVNDTLDWSKLEAGKMELDEEDFHLAQAVESVVELMAPTAQTKRVRMASVLAPEAHARFHGDMGRLRQVLLNLVSNAVKFTDSGEITVRAFEERSEGGRTEVRFEVRDTGIGIPRDEEQLLFKQFSQLDHAPGRKRGGTGLGLSICQRLVQLMGGRIGFCRNGGVGTTFWFVLPLVPRDSVSKSRRLRSSLRTLLICDSAGIPSMIEQQLRTWEVATQISSSGNAALVAILEASTSGQPFDLVILEQERITSGAEDFAAQMKSTPGLAHIPLFLFAAGSETALGRATNSFEAVFPRPLRASTLLETLRSRFGEMGNGHVVEKAPSVPAVSRSSRPVSGPARPRILLADDNAIGARVTAGYLERAGYRVDVVATGFDAVKAVQARKYDLVLMDMQMPKLDGYGAARAIRELSGDKKEVPIIALTANTLPGDKTRSLQAGMDDHISKPITRELLLAKVCEWTTLGRERVAPEESLPAAPRSSQRPVARPDTESLQESLGTTAFAEISALFCVRAKREERALERAAAACDITEIARRAHSLVGAAGAVGLHAVADQARALEEACLDGRTDAAIGDIDDFVTALREARMQLEVGSASLNEWTAPKVRFPRSA